MSKKLYFYSTDSSSELLRKTKKEDFIFIAEGNGPDYEVIELIADKPWQDGEDANFLYTDEGEYIEKYQSEEEFWDAQYSLMYAALYDKCYFIVKTHFTRDELARIFLKSELLRKEYSEERILQQLDEALTEIEGPEIRTASNGLVWKKEKEVPA